MLSIIVFFYFSLYTERERRVHVTHSVDLYSGQIIVKNMSVSFRLFMCFKYLSREFQLYTSSSGSISKGLFDVLHCFSVYCCDFSYFHIYS